MRLFASRFVVFAALPLAVVFALGWAHFPTLYFTVPAFLPLGAYLGSDLWPSLLNSAGIGLIAAYIARTKPWARAFLLFAAVTVATSVLVHLGMNLLGFTYTMEAP
jgi:hypothetical protein